MIECTEDRFLSDVANHQMFVIRDNGVDRHIKFSAPGTNCYRFNLITWPGRLCIDGDCGTYVFSRIKDMFEFFRTESNNLYINPGYWGEKLISIGVNSGYKEFDRDSFMKRVTGHFNSWKKYNKMTKEQSSEIWEEIESRIFSTLDEGEYQAYNAIHEFEYEGFSFNDFFDGGGTDRYTFHYLWCLYAINWGISQYDAAKNKDHQSDSVPP